MNLTLSHMLIAPLLVPFLTMIGTALLTGRPLAQKALSLASTGALFVFSVMLLRHVDEFGPVVMYAGGWPAPFGVAFVADSLSAVMLCLSTGVATAVLAYSTDATTREQQRHFFYPLFQTLILGVNWSFITGDLFNLFVAYEVMLIGSYGSLMLGASRAQLRQAIKYIAINVLGGTLFVVVLGLIYATCGTLNMADLSLRTAELSGSRAALVTAVSMVLLVVFALKAAVFPLMSWLPDSYPVVPAGVIGYFAALLTKVGVYSLLRAFVMVFRQEGHELTLHVLLVMSGLSMVLGVMGAMCQWDIPRILSWHSVSQAGFMVMGIGLAAAGGSAAELAVAGCIYFCVHHAIVKGSLFMIGGMVERVTGTQQLRHASGVLDLSPATAGLFLVAALSLAGLPPLTGFVGKFMLMRAGLQGGYGLIVGLSIFTSFLTLYSMTKIWSYTFWGKRSPEKAVHSPGMLLPPVAAMVLATALLGVLAQPLVSSCRRAAATLLYPQAYIRAVLPAEYLQMRMDAAQHVPPALPASHESKGVTP